MNSIIQKIRNIPAGIKTTGKYLLGVIVFIWLIIAAIRIDNALFNWNTTTTYGSVLSLTDSCNVYGINIHGDIVEYATDGMLAEMDDITQSEDIVAMINEINNDDQIRGVLFEIDSYGGYPVAGEEIARAIQGITKPNIAMIRSGGASAAYMVASSADRVIASKYSDVGGIGVTASYLQSNNNGQFIDLSSGKYKDVGNPDRPITDEERSVILQDVVKAHKQFIEDVAEYRGMTIDQVSAFADGATMNGLDALQKGLIDGIGSWDEAKQYLKKQIGTDVDICW